MYIPLFVFTLLLSILLTIVLVALVFSYYCYRMRRVVVDEQSFLLPEETRHELKKHINDSRGLLRSLAKDFKSFRIKLASEMESQLSETSITKQLVSSIEQRDQEIDRLRKGYEAHILKSCIDGFLDLHDFLLELKQQEDLEVGDIDNLIRLHKAALAMCAVKVHYPEIGQSITEDGRYISDTNEYSDTSDEQKDLTIQEVISPAYLMNGPGENSIIRQAKVRIYRYKNGEH